MGIIAVLTNVALLAMSPEVQELVSHLSTAKFILLFVAVEVWTMTYIITTLEIELLCTIPCTSA